MPFTALLHGMRAFVGAIRGLYFVGFALVVMSAGTDGQEPVDSSQSLFGLDNVIDVHIHMEPAEWQNMQPPKGTRLDFLSVMMAFEDVVNDANNGGHFWSDKSTRPGLAGYLGIDHQYGRANVTIDGQTIDGVGVRYKGNGTFIEGQQSGRLSLKIDFNEYDEEQEFRGLTKINLNNNASDPSLLREALSYELFREADIPCSRVGFARVSATVPGEFEEKQFGLYTVVEQVDKRFLKDRYGSAKGLLLKPSTFGVFRYFGEEWSEYEKGYVPKTTPLPEQHRRVIEFARLLHQADDATFNSQVEDYLDVDQFLRFLAVNVLVCNLDSFLGGAQNHYIYLEPESNKFQFLPWDMDHSFGAFPLLGTPESRRDLSVDHPGGDDHTLIERVLRISAHKQTYHAYLNEYLNTIFAEEKLHRQVTEAAEFLRPMVTANGPTALDRFEKVVAETPRWDEPHAIKPFVHARRESVRSQLDGRSEGKILHNEQGKSFPVRKIIGFSIAMAVLLCLHFIGLIWGVVAGFRSSLKWGLLNLVFYPVAPTIYGFRIQRALGIRAASWVLFSVIALATWFVAAIIAFS
jgi:hypothetical protein